MPISKIEDAIKDVLGMSRYSSLDKDELFDIISQEHSSLYEDEAKIIKSNLVNNGFKLKPLNKMKKFLW